MCGCLRQISSHYSITSKTAAHAKLKIWLNGRMLLTRPQSWRLLRMNVMRLLRLLPAGLFGIGFGAIWSGLRQARLEGTSLGICDY
jgi:hypothetical protein